MNARGTPLLLYVITALLVTNIALTAWLVTSGSKDGKSEATTTQLPKVLINSKLDEIIKNFKTFYNANNFHSLYNMFDDLAKV